MNLIQIDNVMTQFSINKRTDVFKKKKKKDVSLLSKPPNSPVLYFALGSEDPYDKMAPALMAFVNEDLLRGKPQENISVRKPRL